MKRIFSLLLCLILCLSLFPAALAEEPGTIEPAESAEPDAAVQPQPSAQPEYNPENGILIDELHFPDKEFREALDIDIDADGDGFLTSEELAATALFCAYCDIHSLQGVEYFTELKHLSCPGNYLSSLDLSQNTQLEKLLCFENQLKTLDLSHNTKLRELKCMDNQIGYLDLSHNPELQTLLCNGNLITTLNISACPKLIKAYTEGTVTLEDGYAYYMYDQEGESNFCRLRVDQSVYVVTTPPYVPAEIVTQPKSVTVAEGATAKFTVEAKGTDLHYQWFFKKPGAGWAKCSSNGYNTKTYSVTATAARNGYQYFCSVENNDNTATTQIVTLTVVTKPAITTQPKSLTAYKDTTAKFTVAASGGALSYQWQWRRNSSGTWADSSAAGAKTATLSVSAAESRNGYQYRCRVKNAAGTTYSSAATLTVSLKPVITTQPKNLTAAEGSTAKFTVAAAGASSYRWQWRKNSSGIWADCSSATAGYNTATLSVSAAASRSGYQYRCKVSNSKGTVYSGAATLSLMTKPTITAQPKSLTAYKDSTAKFTVKASGVSLSYQWQWRKNSSGTWADSSATGAKTATLSVTAAESRSGYQYRCRVKNAAGTVYSSAATLTVSVKPVITAQPKSVTAAAGGTAKFSVTAAGASSYRWQWRKNSSDSWADCSSATTGYNTATLSVSAAASRSGYQYRCKVTNSKGTTYSSAATLTVN